MIPWWGWIPAIINGLIVASGLILSIFQTVRIQLPYYPPERNLTEQHQNNIRTVVNITAQLYDVMDQAFKEAERYGSTKED